MDKSVYYVYILTNKKDGVLYIGKTSNLIKRVDEHRMEVYDSFTKKYNLKKIIYYEQFPDEKTALTRERQMKKWNRSWKIELIEKHNPKWDDLYDDIYQLFLKSTIK